MTTEQIQRAARPPLKDLCRSAPFAIRADDDGEAGDGLTLDGYAAVFNRETIIDSWEGKFKERIAPGAMKKSFRENPPVVQFDHGRHTLIGSIPIAALEAGYPREETDPALAPEGGAHVIARMHDNWLIQPVRDAIASRTVDGMSFRFSVVREQWHDHTGKRITDEEDLRALLRRTWLEDVPDEELLLRTLQELKVPELGPVVWPAYADTSVGMRSQTLTIDLGRLDDPEERTKLAQAVLMADQAELDTDDAATHREAGEHVEVPDDTPPVTAEEAADEHESATPRNSAVLDVLREVRQSLTTVANQKGRYSS